MGRWTNLACLAAAIGATDHYRRHRARAQLQERASADRTIAVAAALRATSANGEPFIAIVMSALNEATSIGGVIADLPESVCDISVRTIVVDDGSTDGTAGVADHAGAIVAQHPRNLGQGDGLRTGFAVALGLGAMVIVTMDADGQHDPASLPDLIEPVVMGRADYVQGSRFLGDYDDAGGARHAGIKVFTILINALAGTTITDCTNGYRAVRASGVAQLRLVEDRFSASEIIIQASAHQLRMVEVPVHIRSREVGESKKPGGLRYPLGYLAAIGRSWVRARADHLTPTRGWAQ